MGQVQYNLLGNTYGNWEVKEYTGKSKYNCQCKLCGTIREISGYFLNKGQIPKCTCMTGRANSKGLIGLTGKSFGEWKVLEYAGDKNWKCQCSCGRVKIIPGCDLRNGKTTKCKYTHTNGLDAPYRNMPDFKELDSGGINLYGKSFSDWKVLYYIGNSMWKCQCSCGNIKAVNEKTLVYGSSKSCGHSTTGFKDLTGMSFSSWYILKKLDTNGNYLCRCKCGNEKIVNRYQLVKGFSKSCGCMSNECRQMTNKIVYGAPTAGQAKANRIQEQIELFSNPIKLKEVIASLKIQNNGIVSISDIARVTGIGRGCIRAALESRGLIGEVLISKSYSSYEAELYNLYPDLERHNRSILDGQEIDFYSSIHKFGIEFNGSYWHSEIYKEPEYHRNKTLLSRKKGVRLLHIFEYEWNAPRKKRIILSIINSVLNKSSNNIVYARNCVIKEVSSTEASEFLNNNHIQGSCNAHINFGAFYNNEMIGIMTFGKPRFNSAYQYEMLRLAWKVGYIVVGGSEHIFSHFISEHNPNSIISYCDASKFIGDVYSRLGFKHIGMSKPNYVWCNTEGKVISRYNTQKHRLVEAGLGTNEDTESDIMQGLGYYRVSDCGNDVFEWSKK